MIFSHIQALLEGGRVEGVVLQAVLPAMAERWAQADAQLRGTAHFAEFLLTRELLQHLAAMLDARGIDVLLFGEFLLRTTLTEAPWQCACAEPELFVMPKDFTRAVALVASQGFEVLESSEGAALLAEGFPSAIFLRRELPVAAVSKLRGDAFMRRAHVDDGLFEAPLLLADPLDAYVYAVANSRSERLGPTDQTVRDLGELAHKHGLSPQACARHLLEADLAPAARYVLPWLAGAHREHARRVLLALPQDRLTDAIAALARFGVEHCTQRRVVAVPFYLLESSKRRGLRKLARKLRTTCLPWSDLPKHGAAHDA